MAKYTLGLALSGGGYRAAAYHLGTMRKLDELNLLSKVDVLSTISGGSITGALYCSQRWNSFQEFEAHMTSLLTTKDVTNAVLRSWFFLRTILFILLVLTASVFLLYSAVPWTSPILVLAMFVLLVRFQFSFFPASRAVEKAYDNYFFYKKTLGDLVDIPTIVIGSTDTQSSRPFTFSKLYMGGSAYHTDFQQADFPVARAVMASSCVPFAFTPVHIDAKYYPQGMKVPALGPELVDGGVYDNQGIHKLSFEGSRYEASNIIVSDAGNKMPFTNAFGNVFALLIRTMDVLMMRIKDFQMIAGLYENTIKANRQIAYISLGWDLDQCIPGWVNNLIDGKITNEVIAAHQIPVAWLNAPKENRDHIEKHLAQQVGYEEIIKEQLTDTEMEIARSVCTGLSRLSLKQVNCLTQQSYLLTALQIKLYCPSI